MYEDKPKVKNSIVYLCNSEDDFAEAAYNVACSASHHASDSTNDHEKAIWQAIRDLVTQACMSYEQLIESTEAGHPQKEN